MNTSYVRKEARQLLTNLVGKYKLFLMPILALLFLGGWRFQVFVNQQQFLDDVTNNLVTTYATPTPSSHFLFHPLSFIVILFFVSASYTLLEAYRGTRTVTDYKDSLRAFSGRYFFKILLVYLAQCLLFLPWIALIILPSFLYLLLIFSMFFSGHYPDAGILSLLFISSIIGIIMLVIKTYAYSQSFLVLFDRIEKGENTNPFHVIKESVQLMKGRKLEFLFLQLSFIGWFLLVVITAGIAAFYVLPYYQAATVVFYEDIKKPEPAPLSPLS